MALDHCFVENKPRAEKAVGLSINSQREGFTSAALELAVEVIKATPGWHRGYYLLAQALDLLGEHAWAAECHRCRVPDILSERYFSRGLPAAHPGKVSERIPVLARERVALSPPGHLCPDTSGVFDRKAIVAEKAYIDRIIDGRCWQDSNNTIVFDSAGGVIAEHSVGNESVVRHLMSDKQAVDLGGRVFVIGARGSGNYYHWMTDILPKLALCQHAGIEFSVNDKFVVPMLQSRYQLDSLRVFGIEPQQIYSCNDHSPDVTADELIVPLLRNALATTMSRWLPTVMQEKFLPDYKSASVGNRSPLKQDRKLFISRDPNNSKGRTIINHEEVAAFFEQQEFEIIFPEKFSVSEQARIFSEASVVVGSHGAGLTNIIFCQPGTKVIEFYGKHVAPCYWAISVLLGLHYYHHICVNESAKDVDQKLRSLADRRSANFSISLTEASAVMALAQL